jgi:hypothetical protein
MRNIEQLIMRDPPHVVPFEAAAVFLTRPRAMQIHEPSDAGDAPAFRDELVRKSHLGRVRDAVRAVALLLCESLLLLCALPLLNCLRALM